MKNYRAVVIALLVLIMAGCASSQTETGIRRHTFEEIKPPPPGPVGAEPYRIRSGDAVFLNFIRNPELNVDQSVRPDGKISLVLLSPITVAGLTLDELRTTISARYKDFIAQTGYGEVLKEGDDIQIRFVYNPELNQSLSIRPDGKISMPIIGDIQAANVRPADLRKRLIEEYAKHIKRPDVTVLLGGNVTKKIFAEESFVYASLSKPADQGIFVGGEVHSPRMVKFNAALTTFQAIMEAGGVKDSGDLKRVVVLRRGLFEQAEWIQTDLSDPLQGKNVQNDVILRNGDLVIVPRTGIAQLGLFVKQYIRDVLPIQSYFNVTFSHDF